MGALNYFHRGLRIPPIQGTLVYQYVYYPMFNYMNIPLVSKSSNKEKEVNVDLR
jgi:hypothetical protein